jgi:hypothetical protein
MISIADMDIVHLVRAFKNDRHRLANQLTDKDLIRQNEDLVSANRQLARQHDIWKEKAMNMMEKSSYDDIEDTLKNTIKSNNELIQLNKQLKESLRQVNLTPTVSTQAYDIAWKNIDELNDQVKSLLEVMQFLVTYITVAYLKIVRHQIHGKKSMSMKQRWQSLGKVITIKRMLSKDVAILSARYLMIRMVKSLLTP